jgi:hypothetical protein
MNEDTIKEVERLREQLASYEKMIDTLDQRCEQATDLWRRQDPQNRHNKTPDLGEILTWLMYRRGLAVLQEWVCRLPLRHQGVLCSAVRGCDEATKPGGIERHLSAYLRWTFMVPADERELVVDGAFMRTDPPAWEDWKPSQLGHFPLHYVMHLMHAYQVVGAHHPDSKTALECRKIYECIVHSLHLMPESSALMDVRLTEDRFISGTVVS